MNLTCSSCDKMFRDGFNLKRHEEVHKKKLKRFLNYEEFISWKQEMEKRSKSKFVYIRNCKQGNKRYYYYSCYRSGNNRKKSPDNRRRKMKAQGSCKLGAVCTAFIRAVEDINGHITVNFSLDHTGHDPKSMSELAHLKVPLIDKVNIADKLAAGISFDTVLQDVRDEDIQDIPEPVQIITKKDLHNIMTEFNISPTASQCSVTPTPNTQFLCPNCHETTHFSIFKN